MIALGVVLLACGPSTQPGDGSGSETSASSTGSTAVTTSTDTVEPTTSGSADGSSTSETSSTVSGESDSSTGPLVCLPVCKDLGNCNNGIDDDGDGLVDADDPECLSPCHYDEESTHHGYPGGGADCWGDCFWDDNYGAGDDSCYTNTRCDPIGPEEDNGCEPYPDPSPGLCDRDAVGADCLPACLPLTPPGCDCFGCCTVPTPGGPQDLWMSDLDCTLGDPSACSPCTKNEVCVSECDDPCEWCFGEPAPPEGCDEVTCDEGTPCSDQCDCADGRGCLLGCCRPLSIGA